MALLGNTVSNEGSITVQQGTVSLGAGSAATLTFSDNSLVNMQIDQSVLNSLSENSGLIHADGGLVIMNAGAKDALLASVVNNTGIIEAHTVAEHEGSIILLGGMEAGTVSVDGTLDASAPTVGNGGFIETSAAHVKIADDAVITTAAPTGKTGTWLIDPVDFTISAGTGGDITGDQLTSQLLDNNIEIKSISGTKAGAGDINVNDNVSWSLHTLTLIADHSINVNAIMAASGSSKLDMTTSVATPGGTVNMGFNDDVNGTFKGQVNFGDRSGTGILRINDQDYTIINSLAALGTISSGYYALGNDLTATGTYSAPIISTFFGTFDGLGHKITDFKLSSTSTHIGLFGTTSGDAVIQNIGMEGGSVTGGVGSGGLVGTNVGKVFNSYNTGTVTSTGGDVGGLIGTNTGTVSNSHATGKVIGAAGTGGLIGTNAAGTVSYSYAKGAVTGDTGTGGLIGANDSGLITNNYATGEVTTRGAANAGGLVGYSHTGGISNSHATGNVSTGSAGTGGLLGAGTSGNVTNSYATGNVSGKASAGGLVGSLEAGVVSFSYATGNVSGETDTGGLVGLTTGAINTSYATGNVTGVTTVGGLVGNTSGTILNTYATGDVTGTTAAGGLIGITTTTVTNSYAAGSITNGLTTGLVGSSSTAGWYNTYFDKTKNTGYTEVYGTPLTTAEMQSMSKFVGFDISNASGSSTVWRIYEGITMPLLRNFLTPITLSSAYSGVAKVLADSDFRAFTTTIAGAESKIIATKAGLTLSSTATAGTQMVLPNGYGSLQQGYDISYASTTVTGTGSAANDLNIGKSISWSSGTLTLNAQNNINFKAILTGSGTAKLALEYGNDYSVSFDYPVNLPAGQNFTTKHGSDGIKNYIVITALGAPGDATTAPSEAATLQSMAAASNLVSSKNFVLGSNIDASSTSPAGFTPIGTSGTPFFGWFDGLGHTITGLYVNLGATADAGLFGNTKNNTLIQNVGLVGGSVQGGSGTGGLVGFNDAGLIRNSYNTGSVKVVDAKAFTGGLVGQNISGTIQNCYATGTIIGAAYTGGLVGGTTTGDVKDSYATGQVTGAAGTGGLVGTVTTGSVSNSYATGNIHGAAATGGLLGSITTGSITNSYAIGTVWGGAGTGGLAGSSKGLITTSHATGSVRGTIAGIDAGGAANVGGLVGSTMGDISSSYATGSVTGDACTGGLAGTTTGGISISFATGNVTGGAAVGGLAGSSTSSTTNTYATGDVVGDSNVGGLIGSASGLPVTNSYAVGKVTGAVGTSGALMGTSTGGNSNNFFDKGVNGAMTGVGDTPGDTDVTGKSNAEMKLQGTFTAWSFTDTWLIIPGTTMPFLKTFMIPVTVTATNASNTYTGVAYSGGNGATYSGLVNNESSSVLGGSLAYSGTSQSAINVGSYVITPGGIISTQKYLVSFVDGALTIGKAPLGITVAGTYSGSTTIAPSSFTPTGLVNSETITSLSSAVLNSKNVADNSSNYIKSIVVGTGTASVDNYLITQAYNGTAGSATTNSVSLSSASLTVNNLTGNNTIYDATTAVILSGMASIAPLGNDVFTLGGTPVGTFADKNVGLGKAVTVTGSTISGTDSGNYTLLQQSGLSADITAKAITISGLTASDKVYDALLTATLGGTAAGWIVGDAVTVSATGLFDTKDIGTGKTVTLTSRYSGADKGNYTITDQGSTTADISAKAITISGLTAGNKEYDATRTATVGVTAAGWITGDAVTVSATGLFDTKNVGTGKTVTLTSTYSGADKGNYTITDQGSTTANITSATLTVRDLSVTGLTANNKIYDGTRTATLSGTASIAPLGTDDVTLGGTPVGTFADKNVGLGKAVIVTGSTISGTDSGNYTLLQRSGLSADIAAKAITISGLTSSDKVYDALLTATLGGTAAGWIAGDAVTVSATGLFDTKDIGTGKTVTLTSSYGGADKGNYTITDQSTTTADIMPALLTVHANNASKITGTPNPDLTGWIDGFAGTDNLANATTGSVQYVTTATTASMEGEYLITVKSFPVTLYSNYIFNSISAYLTVTASLPPLFDNFGLLPMMAFNTISYLQSEAFSSRIEGQLDSPFLALGLYMSFDKPFWLLYNKSSRRYQMPTLKIINGGIRLPVNRFCITQI